jgi:hypothetical protein
MGDLPDESACPRENHGASTESSPLFRCEGYLQRVKRLQVEKISAFNSRLSPS